MIEILIAMVIFTIFASGIFYMGLNTLQRTVKIEVNNEALLYAEEGLEAGRNIRDRNYLDLVTGEYGLMMFLPASRPGPAPENIDDYYSRTITVENVYRDENGDIAEIGTLDEEIKKITSEVSWTWKDILPMSVSLTTYLTNWRSDAWLQTTCAEFENGTFNDTDTQETPAPPDNNCAIQLLLVEELSLFFSSVDVGEHGNDIAVDENYAYLATAKNAEGLAIADITDRDRLCQRDQINIGGKGRYLTKDGNYAYIGVENSSKGLAIVDVTDPENPSLLKNYNLGAYGNQAAISGNYLFMGINKTTNSLAILDITNKSNPTAVTSIDFNAITNVIEISEDYAYIGTNHATQPFKVLDISNPASPTQIGSLNLGNEVKAIEIYGNTFAFVGTTSSTLKVLNISDPANPTLITSISTSGSIQDLAISENYLYATVNNNNPGVDVFNISNPLSPYLAYSADITGKGTGAYTDNEYVYMGVDVNNRGLVIMEALNPTYRPNGEYISDIFDTGSADTRYDFMDWESSEVVGGIVKLQIRTSSTEDNITSATWIGPDGTSATYYETPRTEITTSATKTGVRYFQFKIIATSNMVETPSIESVIVQYTP